MSMRVGVDIVEIYRIKDIFSKWGEHFLERVYTLREQREQAKLTFPLPYLAGRWAAKEAIMKALGCSYPWTNLEITNLPNGAPKVTLLNGINSLSSEDHVISISISHSRDYAVAVAIWNNS